jgi:hypothetical protein
MRATGKHLIIVGFGPVAGYKYSRSIRSAIERGDLADYSIVDLVSQRKTVLERLQNLPVPPKEVVFIPDPPLGAWANISDFDSVCNSLGDGTNSVKVFISTEPKAHEAYLRYCIDRDIDSIVTKPAILPMRNGRFDASLLVSRMTDLVQCAAHGTARHAVLCLGRHHEIYEHEMRQPVMKRMTELAAPITSFHLRTSSGVWNLADEYESREDHPYKYAYGMLMHGGYHYIDVMCEFLALNKKIYPHDDFELELSSYSAFPSDQTARIPKALHERLSDFADRPWRDPADAHYGETDLVTSYCLRNKRTKRVLTLGTLSLEQSTPGMRSWAPFPEVEYNKNGRLHCTDIEVALSTAFSMHCRVIKIPVEDKKGPLDLRARNFARVSARTNASLDPSAQFYTEKTIERPFGNSFSYSAETDIFDKWLSGSTTGSDLDSHLTTTAVLQALAESVFDNGRQKVIDFP